jgi:hypothetical protein
VFVTAGANGKACFLPNPALTATVGEYIVHAVDANYLTIAPTNGATMNGGTAALPAIKGPHAYYVISRRSDTAWHITSVGSIGYGEPLATVCAKTGGNTNNSASGSGSVLVHDLTCTLPANTLTAGSSLRVCPHWHWVTGAAAPQMQMHVQLGGMVVSRYGTGSPANNITDGKNGVFCSDVVVGEIPSGASAVYAGPEMAHGLLSSGLSPNTVTQPQDVATNAAVDIQVGSRWDAAGTGTNTWTLLSLTVYGSGLKP